MELRRDLPPLPARMRRLPIDERGFPVPWFVAFIEGKPDFRVVRPHGMVKAIQANTCWVCGQPLGIHLAFVIGPMCAVNRVTSEPPSHLECARFAAKACPFLANPRMARSPRAMPQGAIPPSDMFTKHLERNPGVACLWITRSFKPFRAPEDILLQVGAPENVEWWAQGRAATAAEVRIAITSGLPFLREIAEQDGPDAIAELTRNLERVRPLLPGAT